MKAHVLLVVIVLMVVSCNQYKTISFEEYQGYAEEIGLELPDSLKTEEQIAIKEKMMEITIKQVSEISEFPINLKESLQEAKKEFSNK